MSGILEDMQDTPATSIRVARSTRDELRELADADGLTLDGVIRRLVRAERQRRMGIELANAAMGDHERAWLDLAADTIGSDAGG